MASKKEINITIKINDSPPKYRGIKEESDGLFSAWIYYRKHRVSLEKKFKTVREAIIARDDLRKELQTKIEEQKIKNLLQTKIGNLNKITTRCDFESVRYHDLLEERIEIDSDDECCF